MGSRVAALRVVPGKQPGKLVNCKGSIDTVNMRSYGPAVKNRKEPGPGGAAEICG